MYMCMHGTETVYLICFILLQTFWSRIISKHYIFERVPHAVYINLYKLDNILIKVYVVLALLLLDESTCV